ncbi:invasion associated locus B family protein [Jannaschia marina]|uniref:invasion associated locus B family protein n=1 Tax=Jannaschia marina TaxID=2741674 RepID=UPI002E2C995E|nr:invasion associated locus B family protein [Jannaschia marina]
MIHSTRFLPAVASVLALSLMAAPGLAQETDTEDAGTATEAPETGETAETPEAGETLDADQAPPASPGGDLSTGTSVGEALSGGPQIYVREEHGDWEVRCLEAPEGQDDPCQLYQRLADQQGNPTADVNFFDLPDGGEIVAGATVLTPLQTLLTAQVTMTIDGGQPRRYPYSFCDQTGCYSRMGFTAADVQAFRRGAKATLVVVPALAPDQQAELTMSLTGFTAGLAAVEVANE